MHAIPLHDTPELLRRYDRPGPRYTSYPTAPQFHAGFGETELREAARRSNGDPIPRPLSIYVHVPFCSSPCFYCGCNRVITRDPERATVYLQHLAREIALVAPLFDPDREVMQLHFGGGTPNVLSPAQLSGILRQLQAQFRFGDARMRDLSIELDPRFVTAEDIGQLASAGFNRASLGVQDFDPVVQAAVNRVQGIEATRAVIDACRRHGFASINLDLIHGLPGQTRHGFARTLDTVAALRPDRVALYGYAHMPHLFRAQRRIDAQALPDAATRLGLLADAIARLEAAGYVHIGMDHFALPTDSLARAQAHGRLHRNFMGYTSHADSDLIGLGVSAISHIDASYSQNPRDIATWQAALSTGRLPVFRGLQLDDDDLLRAELIQAVMCHGEIPVAALERRHGIAFERYFADALQQLAPLAEDGLVRHAPGRIVVTRRGRLLLRHVAMCFDRYLAAPADAVAPRFSRAL